MFTVTICVVPRYSVPYTSPRSGACVAKDDMLRPDAEDQLALGAILAQLRELRSALPAANGSVAPPERRRGTEESSSAASR